MSSDDEYYIPEGIEDEFLHSMAFMAKDLLNQKKTLDTIFKKHVGSYNTTLKERCSVKFLQAMTKNHKSVFPTPSVIISPEFSDGSAKKITKAEFVIKLNLPHRTPVKSQVSSSTERKQLFDESNNGEPEFVPTVTKTSDESQLKITSLNKNLTDQEKIGIRVNTEEGTVRNLSSSFNGHAERDSIYDTQDLHLQERFNLYGKPETITRLSFYDQDTEDLADKTSYEPQTTIASTDQKTATSLSNTINESKSDPFLKTVSSIFDSETNVKDSDNSDAQTKENVIVDAKQETDPEFSVFDKHSKELLNKTPHKHQTMAASPQKQRGTLINCTTDDTIKAIRERENCSFEERTENSDTRITKEQETFLSVKHTASNLSIDHQSINRSSKTPEKFQITNANTSMKEKTPVEPIILTVRSLSNDQKDIKNSHIPNMNKRKSPSMDYSDETATTYSAEDPEFEVPLKMPKINDGFTINDKKAADFSAMACCNSFILIDEDPKHRKKNFNLAVDSTIAGNSSLNPDGDSAMDNDSSLNDAFDSSINGISSFNDAGDSSTNGISSFNVASDSITNGISSFNVASDSITNGISSFNVASDSITNGISSDNSAGENGTGDASSFDVAADSAIDTKDSDNQSNNNFINEQETVHCDDKSITNDMSTIPTYKPGILSFSLVEKVTETAFQTTVTQDSASCFTAIDDQKKTVDVISDNSNSKNDQIRISSAAPPETKDVESLTSLMQNLSPSVKRSFDGISKKTIVKVSGSSNETFTRQLFLRDDLQKASSPPRESPISEVSILKSDNIYSPQKSKFVEMLEDRKTLNSRHLPLFFEDYDDLTFIYEFIKAIINIVELIPIKEFKEELPETVTNVLEGGSKLLHKVLSWKYGRESDLAVWDDCLMKIERIHDEIKNIEKENKQNVTLKDLLNWETSLRALNKTVDDMILLREIRRPTVLQLGYEIKNLIQLFVRYVLLIGILKPSSRVSSD